MWRSAQLSYKGLRNVATRGNVRDMTGTDLKIKRIAAHVKAKDLGEVLGWSSAKISRLEARAYVDPNHVEEYVAALATMTTTTTEPRVA